MSRSDQWIGLTNDAQAFVKDLDFITVDKSTLGNKRFVDAAFYPYPFELGEWRWHNAVIREKLQCSPWSSGPMHFTYLEIDYGNGFTVNCFQWVNNPLLGRNCSGEEYNPVTGHMWV